jgi:D-alanyl-D-alanine carboxypeptidase/D-alanyl-D-alanine-endopeptidase (penicillin-binding protein 4)
VAAHRLHGRGRHGRLLVLAGVLLALGGCAAVPDPRGATLPPPVARALQCTGLPESSLGLWVGALDGRGSTLQRRADDPMQPGSTIKLLTSAVALETLGPNHRGHTELLTAAPQVGEVLQGDVVLRGGADPELTLPQVWQMLSELRWQGVREITGDLVLDRSLFRPERMDLGLPPFDEAPEFPYNVIPDALLFSGHLVGLELESDATTVRARLLPPLPGVTLDTRALVLNDKPCRRWDDGWKTPSAEVAADGSVTVRLEGGFPAQCRQRPWLQLFDRDLQTERQWRSVWEGLGGTWRGRVRSGPTPEGARLLARHEARPWGELMRPLNKQSDNVLARLLYLSLGLSERAGDPQADSAALSDRVVRRWLAGHRIEAPGLVLDNGSGLSRSERVSPRTLAEAVRTALNGPNGSDLLMSLPTVGVDGTMRNRLKTSPAAGRARLKTGTLRNVNALAGVVPGPDGRVWVVAAMINDDAALPGGRGVLDALIDWIARTGLQPSGWDEQPAPCERPPG